MSEQCTAPNKSFVHWMFNVPFEELIDISNNRLTEPFFKLLKSLFICDLVFIKLIKRLNIELIIFFNSQSKSYMEGYGTTKQII